MSESTTGIQQVTEKPKRGKKPTVSLERMLEMLPEHLQNPVIEDICKGFYDNRLVKNAPLTEHAWDIIIRRVGKTDMMFAVALMKSTEIGYQGVFEPTDRDYNAYGDLYRQMVAETQGRDEQCTQV